MSAQTAARMDSGRESRPMSRWRVALACAVLAGCNNVDNVNEFGLPIQQPEPTEIADIEKPRVAMLSESAAAVTYFSVRRRGSAALAEQVTSIQHLAGAVSGDGSFVRRDVRESNLDMNVNLGAIGDGVGLLLTPKVGLMSEFEACVLSASGPARCETLDPFGLGSLAAAVSPAAGEVLALIGPAESIKQRTYSAARGWSERAGSPNFALPPNSGLRADPKRSVVRGRDGSLYFAVRAAGRPVVARFDPRQDAWLPPEPLDVALGGEPDRMQIALHPAAPVQSPLAVWRSGLPSTGIYASTWQEATGWSLPERLPGSAGGQAPAVAMWPNGDAIAVWVESEARVATSRRVGGVWAPAEVIGADAIAPRRGGAAELGTDDQGNAVVVWADVSGRLQSATYFAGAGWQSAGQIGTLASEISGYDVDMSPGGRALAVWARPAGFEPGSRFASAEVGPLALSFEPQRYTFGGDALPIRVRLANPPLEPTTLSLASTLPATALTLPPAVAVAANQQDITINVATTAVSDFLDGSIVLSYGAARVVRPVTLMPETTAVVLSVTPTAVPGGTSATLDVQVTPSYPLPVRLEVALSSSLPIAQLPAQVVVSTNGRASATVTTLASTVAQTAILTGRARNRSGTIGLLVNPTAFGQAVLTAAVSGSGAVTSAPAGIDCGTDCTEAFPLGTVVTLTPVPGAGQRFFAWSGDADCSDGIVTMSVAKACTARFVAARPPDSGGSGWLQLGNDLTSTSEVDPAPSLALDGSLPVVAHVQAIGGDIARLWVRRLDGPDFVVLGGIALNAGSITAASEPSVVTTFAGQPYVAWVQGDGIQQNVFVARFNGTAWESVGAAGIPLNYVAGSTASSPSIALDATLQPMVAWIENGVVKFKRFDGMAWVAAQGGEGPPSAMADRVRLSSDFNGVPALAWTQGGGAARALKVVRDFSFSPLGTQVNPTGAPLPQFSVLSEAAGASVIWADSGSPFTVRAQRWSGAAWVDLGTNRIVDSNPERLVSMAASRRQLAVAYSWSFNAADASRLDVQRFLPTLNGWGATAPTLNNTRTDQFISVSLEMATTDSPVLAGVRRNALNQYRLSVLRFRP